MAQPRRAVPVAGSGRFAEAERLVDTAVSTGRVESAVLRIEQGGEVTERAFGRARTDSVFLIASITKPMTALAVMTLVDRGQLGYHDRAADHLPELTDGDRDRITVGQLLTHTSGLPDMLPDDLALRRRCAPLSEFVRGALTTPLLFPPGTRTSYQSMGILLAAEIVQRITGVAFRDHLRTEVLEPLGMSSTTLGLGRHDLADVVRVQVEQAGLPGDGAETAAWDWNSRWWRDLGAPWGGAHSTAADIARFLDAFLRPNGIPVRAEVMHRMTIDQNRGLDQPYGIGWAVTPSTFGHRGATGTCCWAEPAADGTVVLLTSLPARVSRDSLLDPVVAAVRAAW